MSDLADNLPHLLQLLGDSADRVASGLRAQRIQGVRNTARFLNPICRFVAAAFNLNPLDVQIIDHGILHIACADGTHLEAALPQPIKDFLDAFNREAYPDLEQPMT